MHIRPFSAETCAPEIQGGANMATDNLATPRSAAASQGSYFNAFKSETHPQTSALQPALALPAPYTTQSAAAAPAAMIQKISNSTAACIAHAKELRNAKRFSEALTVLDVQIDNSRNDDGKFNPLDRSELFLWRGKVSQFAKDITAAVAALSEAEVQAERIVDPLLKGRQLAYVVFQHGMALREGHDLESALVKFAQAEPHLRVVGEQAIVSLTERCDMHHNLAFIFEQRGDEAEAIAAYERLLPLRRQAGEPQPLGYTLARLGVLQCKNDRRAVGLENLRQGIFLVEKHGSKSMAETYRAQLAGFKSLC